MTLKNEFSNYQGELEENFLTTVVMEDFPKGGDRVK